MGKIFLYLPLEETVHTYIFFQIQQCKSSVDAINIKRWAY